MKKRNIVPLGIKSLLALLLTVLVQSASATDVSGTISADMTWNLAGSPYVVTGSILVEKAVTLTIEPGVKVKFNADKSMQISGELIARGTGNNKITFTSNQKNSGTNIIFYCTVINQRRYRIWPSCYY